MAKKVVVGVRLDPAAIACLDQIAEVLCGGRSAAARALVELALTAIDKNLKFDPKSIQELLKRMASDE